MCCIQNSKISFLCRKFSIYNTSYVFIVLHVYGILIRHKLVLSLQALRILEEKLCEDGRIVSDPNYELYRQDMLLDEDLMYQEYDPKRKMLRGRLIPLEPTATQKKKAAKKSDRRSLPFSRQDLKR